MMGDQPMGRFNALLIVAVGAIAAIIASVVQTPAWLWVAIPLSICTAIGIWDLLQTKHSILRSYPFAAHFRWLAESIRPELQQYFVESDTSGRPFDRKVRTLIYQRSKGQESDSPFGSQLDLDIPGSEFFAHAIASKEPLAEHPRVRVGGPDCTQPYEMALLNVSALSFGALSANAIRALNGGAKIGGFAHDTGEGGLTRHHLEPGGDLVWEIGSGYFGCRTGDGKFDPQRFREQAQHPNVKCISLKLSQGAKPGIGGVLPAKKVTREIAEARGVPVGVACISPPSHSAFSTPAELIELIAQMRSLSGGKPTGFKLCIGRRTDFLAICKAMLELETTPDFIIVDGSEGGTGAAPLEFEDKVGAPLTEGLLFVHNALVGTGLRDRIRVVASGKVGTGAEVVRRIAQGADYTNAARAMMMALGCIQSLRCHTNRCPVGVATQSNSRARALDVGDKTQRVANYQKATVESALRIIGAMGLSGPHELHPGLVHRYDEHPWSQDYLERFDWLQPDELIEEPPEQWAPFWNASEADRFRPSDTRVPR